MPSDISRLSLDVTTDIDNIEDCLHYVGRNIFLQFPYRIDTFFVLRLPVTDC